MKKVTKIRNLHNDLIRKFIDNSSRFDLFSQIHVTAPVPEEVWNNKMSKIIRKIICSANAPKPVGPYNQAVKFNNTIYISGVLGMDKDTMKLVPGGAAAEARQLLINLGHILKEAGSSYDNVIKNTVLLNDINDFQSVNEVYKEFFKKDFPARSTFQVGKLPLGASVEIESIAASGDVETIPSKL